MRIGTWNVNGIRARFDEVTAWASREKLDVFCLQEIKATAAQVPEPLTGLPDYWSYWHGAPGGYSGVSVHVRRAVSPGAPAFSSPAFDMETRIVETSVDGVSCASVYVPNGNKDYAAKLRFLDGLRDWVAGHVEAGQELLVCGDLNVALTESDVHASHRKADAIGQRAEERERMAAVLDAGVVDVLRQQAGDVDDLFTWWPPWRDEKAKNHGWRIDFVLATPALAARVTDCRVLKDTGTSDHAPVVVTL